MTLDYIYLAEAPANTPAAFLDGGTLYLDLPEGFSFQVTENLGQITDINQLAGNGVLDFTLPATPKNVWVFQEYLSPNALDRVYIPLDVRCFGGRVLAQPQDSMFFKGASESGIDVSLVESDDFWLTLIQKMRLNEVDCGTFTYTIDNLKDNWNRWIATSGRMFWHPLVHYGRFWRQQDQFVGAVVEDFLPWFSIRHLLTQGLRQKGWTLDSPLFTENWFQRLWVDVLATEINYSGKAAGYITEVSLSADFDFGWNEADFLPTWFQPFKFDVEDSDPGGSHQVTNVPGQWDLASIFSNLTEIDSSFKVVLTGSFFNTDDFPVKFDVVAVSIDQNEILDGVYNLSLGAGEEKEMSLEFDIFIPGLSSFYLRLQAPTSIDDPAQVDGGIITVRAGGNVVFTPNSNRIYRGDTVTMSELINPDAGFLEFFKGVVHLMNLKFYTDYANRTVWLYPTEDTDLYGNTVEGFLKPPAEAIDITSLVVQGSRKITVKDDDRKRFYRLKFKKSEDPYITKRLGITEDDPLFSELIDLGRGDDTEVVDLANPFFEPTEQITWNGLRIPAVWDNTEGRRTARHGYRIIMAVGNYAQCLSNDPALATPGWFTFEYIQRSFWPWGCQLPDRAFRNSANVWVNSDESIVYGGQVGGNQSLYSQFWQHEILVRQYSKLYEFLVYLDEAWFINLDFRNRLVINYLEDKGVYRLIKKQDFRTNDLLPVILQVQPEPSKLKTKL